MEVGTYPAKAPVRCLPVRSGRRAKNTLRGCVSLQILLYVTESRPNGRSTIFSNSIVRCVSLPQHAPIPCITPSLSPFTYSRPLPSPPLHLSTKPHHTTLHHPHHLTTSVTRESNGYTVYGAHYTMLDRYNIEYVGPPHHSIPAWVPHPRRV